MKQRPERLAAAIHRSVGYSLLQLFPELQLTVTNVDVTADAREASVWVSSLKEVDQQELLEKLEKHRGELNRAVAGAAELRRLPKMRFYYDDSGRRIQDLFANSKSK